MDDNYISIKDENQKVNSQLIDFKDEAAKLREEIYYLKRNLETQKVIKDEREATERIRHHEAKHRGR